jgi:2-polyprenyl-3-methyl-5-hydroxy-6-metoxy-1,4-benzoquinol methylase
MQGLKEVQQYWDEYTTSVQAQFTNERYGSKEYFREIRKHHDKAYDLSNQIIDLPSLNGKSVLEIGCGIGLDALLYAQQGARVTAIDISLTCIEMAQKYFSYHDLQATFEIQNAEVLGYADNSFDVVVARQVLMYTPHPERAVEEMLRVVRPGGKTVSLLHNRHSWYALLGKVSGTNLVAEVRDPPVDKLHSIAEARNMFKGFSAVDIFLDRYPFKTTRRSGVLTKLYNIGFVPVVNMVPRRILRPFGYYIIIKATK